MTRCPSNWCAIGVLLVLAACGGRSSSTTTAGPGSVASCIELPAGTEGPGLAIDHVGNLVQWREQVITRGGGLAVLDVTSPGEQAAVSVIDVLWEGPEPLDRSLGAVATFLEDPLPQGRFLALISNDGVLWSAVPVSDDGCVSEADLGQTDMMPAVEEIAGRWDELMTWPELYRCGPPSTPPRPERHDEMVAAFLQDIGDVRTEEARLTEIRSRADTLAVSAGSSSHDLAVQLAAGVEETDLVYRSTGDIVLRLPSVDDADALTLFLFEGDPPRFLAWMSAQRRLDVEMALPTTGTTVRAYVMPFTDLGDYDLSCPEAFDGVTPYAVIPAEEFLPPNTSVDLDEWRP